MCITARDEARLAAAVERLSGLARVMGVSGKSNPRDHQESTISATLDAFGRLDILVNTVGINPAYGSLSL